MTKTLLAIMASKLRTEGNCSICQYPKDKQLAAISCCKHTFHFDCIQSWSQITNKCPFCKLRFKFITNLQTQQLISVANKEQKLNRDDLSYDTIENEQYWDSQSCEICKSTDPNTDAFAIICDGCDRIFHTFCIGLQYQIPSETVWFCTECKLTQSQSQSQSPSTDIPLPTAVVYKDDLSDFDINELIPDNTFTKLRCDDSDYEEWLPHNTAKKVCHDFGVMRNEKKRKRKSKRVRKRKFEECDSDNKCENWNKNGLFKESKVQKRRKINNACLESDLFVRHASVESEHSNEMNGMYYGYSGKSEGITVIESETGHKMWNLTFKKRKKKSKRK